MVFTQRLNAVGYFVCDSRMLLRTELVMNKQIVKNLTTLFTSLLCDFFCMALVDVFTLV